MATITYNNRSSSNAKNLVTFTDIPNILKVTDASGGTKQTISLTFNGNLAGVTHTDPWTITIQGETISSVDTYAEAINKSFFVSTSNNTTAASAARALRNCPNIAALYTVQQYQNGIILTARDIGSFTVTVDSNIPVSYLSKTITQGSSQSQLVGSKIDVDVYNGADYITTLEKNFYNGEAAFNMSPVLTTFAKRSKTEPYLFRLNTISQSGDYQLLGTVGTNYISQGYMCNQGQKYLELYDYEVMAQNFFRGDEKQSWNNTLLYVYGNNIPFSFYTKSTSMSRIDVTYRDSAFNVVGGLDWNDEDAHAIGNNYLVTTYIPLTNMPSSTFYVDVKFESQPDFVRYNVIKPLKATEYYQRIYWRNSYGGVSFFDFTGAKTETRDLETTTYQKNIFDYYTDPRNELERVYNNEIKYNVTLKSHLFENDGKYIFNDLAQSPEVWTEINGETYAIIMESVSVDELNDRNNIYEATVRYRYSMTPSII